MWSLSVLIFKILDLWFPHARVSISGRNHAHESLRSKEAAANGRFLNQATKKIKKIWAKSFVSSWNVVHYRSTLRGYLGARFGGEFVPGGEMKRGDKTVFFIPRDGFQFLEYILPFIRGDEFLLREFSVNKRMWRRLCSDATFYCLDALKEKLHVTYSVAPNPSGRGILYWLGTRKGNISTANNPLAVDQVSVEG